jgi:hypothetical protein
MKTAPEKELTPQNCAVLAAEAIALYEPFLFFWGWAANGCRG